MSRAGPDNYYSTNMDPISLIYSYVVYFDARFVETMSKHWFTYDLIHNPLSRIISETLFLIFVWLFFYETIYWSGIYLRLWDYHAKDIFKEVPVHCAHIYVRVNVAKKERIKDVRHYYGSRSWLTEIPLIKTVFPDLFGLFELPKSVKYHFEFSPEDFENNPEPEHGSTIEHLRQRVLTLFKDSSFYEPFHDMKSYSTDDIFITNNKLAEVGPEHDKTYLSKIHIETGNTIDAIILC